MRKTRREDLLFAAGWTALAGAALAGGIAALYLLPGWIGGLAVGLPALAVLARGWIARHRQAVARALGVAAVALMAFSAYAFRPSARAQVHFRPTPQPEVDVGWDAPLAALLGGIALLAALALSPEGRAHVRPRAVGIGAWPRPWQSGIVALAGVGLLAALTEINTGLLGVKALAGVGPDAQAALLAGGIALVAIGLGGLSRLRRPAGARLAALALIAALTAAALAVRFWALATSVRTLVDEGHFALGIEYVWEFPDLRLLEPMPTVASFPYLFSYLQAQAVALIGRDWAGLRAVSAILGGLTIPALYLLARTLYDRLTALLAGLILLTFMPHLHFSRLGLNNIADPLFGTLGLALLARGVQTGRRLDYALGGAALGLTQYFYDGGRMLFPVLAAAWLGAGVVLWRPRPAGRGLLIALLAFALVAAPVYLTLAAGEWPLFNRMGSAGFNADYWARQREPDTLATRWTHFVHAAAMLVNSPENTYIYYYLYYGGQHPLVPEWLVPAFLLGLGFAAWMWRRPGALPLGWVAGTLIGNALIVESAVSARYVVVFPALALLIALGLRETVRLIGPRGRGQRATEGLLVIAGLAIALAQGAIYFGPFLDGFNQEVRAHIDYDADDALLRAQALPPGAHLIIVGNDILPEIDTRRHLAFLRDGLTVRVMTTSEFAALDFGTLPTGTLAFFLPPDEPAAIARVTGLLSATGPLLSPYDLPREKGLWLYIAQVAASTAP